MKSITADAIDLRSKSPLGEWDVSADISQCEYQVGQRLIYVQHPKGDSPRRYVEAAQCWVRDAWLDIDAAVKFAEARSKPLFPEFWEFHKRSGHPGTLLDVYSIHFNYPDARPTYCLSWNRSFADTYARHGGCDAWQDTPNNDRPPEPPLDSFFIDVRRTGPGRFEDAASPL